MLLVCGCRDGPSTPYHGPRPQRRQTLSAMAGSARSLSNAATVIGVLVVYRLATAHFGLGDHNGLLIDAANAFDRAPVKAALAAEKARMGGLDFVVGHIDIGFTSPLRHNPQLTTQRCHSGLQPDHLGLQFTQLFSQHRHFTRADRIRAKHRQRGA